MQDKKLFEYAVIRVVPRVEREEFINVGVILFCKEKGFLQTLFHLDKKRLLSLAPDADMEELESRLKTFQKICSGGRNAGPIGALSVAERFRWLTSSRSTIIQVSPVHPGICNDPEKNLLHLFEKLVM